MIYEEDYKQLCAWVLMKTNIETGGDLFGLWAEKHTAVIQFVVVLAKIVEDLQFLSTKMSATWRRLVRT